MTMFTAGRDHDVEHQEDDIDHIRLDAWLHRTGLMDQLRAALQQQDPQDELQLSLRVDVLSAVAVDVDLGALLLSNTERLRLMVMQHLNDQGLLPSRFSRMWLRLVKVPLPLMSVPQAIESVASTFTSSSTTSTSKQQPVHLYGVITGQSTVQAHLYTRRICCSSCGMVQDVLSECCSSRLHCCDAFGYTTEQELSASEDLSGRVLIPSQSLYVSPLSSATGLGAYGLSAEPLLVHVMEELAGSCSIGDIVEIIGSASMEAKDTKDAKLQVSASNIRPVMPHICWGANFSSSFLAQQQQEPLQFLVDALAVAADQPELSVTTGLALLLSASSVISASCLAACSTSQALVPGSNIPHTAGSSNGSARRQISILMLQPAHAPDGIRSLRAAASLLSPHSIMLSTPLDNLLQPKCTTTSRQLSTDGQQQQMVFGSILSNSNQGIAVADLCSLPLKVVKQLMDTLGKPMVALPKVPMLIIPVRCTLWAVGPDTAINPDALDLGDASHGKVSTSAGGIRPELFDIVIEEASQQGLQVLFAPMEAEDSPEHQELQASLQAHMTKAMLVGQVHLSEGAQAMLQQYFMVLRQSMVSVPQGELLNALIKLASACSRLCHRREAQASPDAAAAVLMMELTLKTRFGSGYQGLGLPGFEDSRQPSLDAYLRLVHKLVQQSFRMYDCEVEE